MTPPNTPRAPGLGLIPAILAGLILRRSGAVPDRAARDSGTANPAENAPEETWDYERSDVAAGKTAWVMLGLAGTVLVTIAAVLLLDHRVLGRQRADLPPLTAQQRTAIRPPPPNLQPDPYADIDARQADEAGRLSGYAYLDAARTRARIPIDRALALMAGRPFDPEPTRGSGKVPDAQGAPAP